jgi:hypothetical protein
VSEWQPIETAPKDGSRIILFWPSFDGWTDFGWWKDNPRLKHCSEIDGIQVSADYFSNSTEMDDYEMAKDGNGPTHWMPMPNPPRTP